MYQDLELFEDTFESDPIWGTEGNDLRLPTLAVGDIFEHESLHNIHWRKPPEPGQVFKVIAIKHQFRETGRGPEADYRLMVAVALDNLKNRQEAELEQLEAALRNQTRRGDFLSVLMCDLANHCAVEVRRKLVQGIVTAMKNMPAHGIQGEAKNAWEESAMILQADGHVLADMLIAQVQSDVRRAIAQLDREDRLSIWLMDVNWAEWFSDDYPDSQARFDPLTLSRWALDSEEEYLTKQLLSLLSAHNLPS